MKNKPHLGMKSISEPIDLTNPIKEVKNYGMQLLSEPVTKPTLKTTYPDVFLTEEKWFAHTGASLKYTSGKGLY